MRRVYVKMTLALVVTALTAMFATESPLFWSLISMKGVFIGLIIAQFGLVIALTAALRKLSGFAATSMFFIYAVLTGLFLTPVFGIYTEASVAKTFFITAGTFGAMSVYGYFTTRDLTTWGRMLTFALIGLVICSLVNIFTRSTAFDFMISALGVLVFIGLTAWDTQKIKQWAAEAPGEATSKLATIGALSLYLDFVNLFLYLLRFFGNRR
ncbi:MAG: Bax inhibitor-1/YccA family protein [Paramuribaculum sp.]|nr:Bax inhibitor-1/YccA family protein [Paramuribaculum sp.]